MTPTPASPQIAATVTAGLEIERQWRVHQGLRLPLSIGDWNAVDHRDELLVDYYYDTEDLQLAAQRARLRVRRAAAADGALRRRIEWCLEAEG